MRKLALICCILVVFMHPAVFTAGSQIQTFSQIRSPPRRLKTRSPPNFNRPWSASARPPAPQGSWWSRFHPGRLSASPGPKDTLVPASLMKLLTSYAALKKLGPSFRFTTKVLAAEAPVEGVISGDIWIKGSGDPFFRFGKGAAVGADDQGKRDQANPGRYFCGRQLFSSTIGAHLPG